MANLAITAANVLDGTGASVVQGRAGATITQGQPVYLDSTTTTYKLAQATTLAASQCKGFALQSVASGQLLLVQTGGAYTPGGTAVVGETYVVSATAGSICPIADLASTNFPCILGVATTASNIILNISAAGVAKP